MKKYYSEAFEAMHGDFLANFEIGAISEAELREFEKDAFVEVEETPQEARVTEHETA